MIELYRRDAKSVYDCGSGRDDRNAFRTIGASGGFQELVRRQVAGAVPKAFLKAREKAASES
jgi:hypothetical protein